MYEPYNNSVSGDNIEENEPAEENKRDDEDDDVRLAVLKLSLDLFECTFDDLIKVDESVRTCDTDLVDRDNTQVADMILKVSNDPVSGSDSETEEVSEIINQANEYVYQLKKIDLRNCAILNLV